MTHLWKSLMDAPTYYNHSPWFPNPLICVRDMASRGAFELVDRMPWNGIGVWLEETRHNAVTTVYLDVYCIPVVVIIALLFTVVRSILDSVLLKRIPEWFNLSENGRTKFPESAWKALVYCVLWTCILIIMVTNDGLYFFNLEAHWNSWRPGLPMDTGVYWIIMLEIGFYWHSIYAHIYLETIRKDFAVMLTHHFVTIGLLSFAYVIKVHLVSIALLFLIDIGDVILEFGKCVIYFKDRNGKQYYWPEQIANVIFALFVTQFFLCRIYWMFTKILYSVMYVGPTWYGPGGPWFLAFVPALWIIYLMQVYWFRLILEVVHKIFIKGEVIEDNRETPNGKLENSHSNKHIKPINGPSKHKSE